MVLEDPAELVGGELLAPYAERVDGPKGGKLGAAWERHRMQVAGNERGGTLQIEDLHTVRPHVLLQRTGQFRPFGVFH